MLPIRKILCPIDYSVPSLNALDAACELALHFDAELLVLHVLPILPADLAVIAATGFAPSDVERGNQAMEQLQDVIRGHVPSTLTAQARVKIGHPAQQITSVAEDNEVGFIVIATHGEGGWRDLGFGSVTQNVLRHTHCPVLTIHGEFRSREIIKGKQNKVPRIDGRFAMRH